MEEVKVAVLVAEEALRGQVAKLFDGAPPGWCVRFTQEPREDAEILVAVGSAADAIDARSSGTHPARVVAVTGTGGTGATTVALHLARDLSARRPATLVDLDLQWRGVAERTGITDPEARTWGQLSGDPQEIRTTALPVPGGFRVLLAPATSNDSDPLAAIAAATLISDTVIVDVPPTGPLGDTLRRADCAVLVFEPTRKGAQRAAAVVERNPGLRWALVANRISPPRDLAADRWRRALGAEPSITLPYTSSVPRAEARGTLVHPVWTRWGRSVARLAAVLESA